MAERLGEADVPPALLVVWPLPEADLTFTDRVPVLPALLVVLAELAFLAVPVLLVAPALLLVPLVFEALADLLPVALPVADFEVADFAVEDFAVVALEAVDLAGEAFFAVVPALAFLVLVAEAFAPVADLPDVALAEEAVLVPDLAAVDLEAVAFEAEDFVLADFVPVDLALEALVALAFLVPDFVVEVPEAFFEPVRSLAVFSTFRTTLFTTLVTASGIMLV
ncbi:hypothetical protein [Adhaeribacter soli]|uniref:hypothetical protein n=1 Tax=Adhaeribacter soli TaxID=2607655 RepID=UPI001783BDEE|nr:hypothetical protein [Adhaeribacter soli]